MRAREALRRERMETGLSVLVELSISRKKVDGRTPKTSPVILPLLGSGASAA